jgi:hypothetical protein
MFDTFMGLPLHALVIHVVVVLVPLAALGTIAMAIVPHWRSRFGVLVILTASAGLAAVPVATQSGKWLKNQIHASGVVAKQINNHQRMGNLVLWPTLAMWVLVIALVVLDRQRRRGDRTVKVVALLASLAALAAAAQVALAGHLGSTAVWSCTIGSSACK